MRAIFLGLSVTALALQAANAVPPKQIVDNERVAVWDITWAQGVTSPVQRRAGDVLEICLTGKIGEVVSPPKSCGGSPARSILIQLKDHPVPPLENKSGYPNAFPRPNVKKILENNRIIAWDYTWTPGVPTPMHYHDKDVVVVYLEDGTLKSTTPDGKSVLNPNSFGTTKFNTRDRSHTEEVVQGKDRAIIIELK